LDINLNETHIRQLRERITHSFHLGPLHTKDISDYLIFRLRAAGYHGPHLFTDAAIKKLSRSAQGLVRRVNILADKALLAAFADNLYQVTPKHVKAAIKDSEFGIKANRSQYVIGLLALSLLIVVLLMVWQKSVSPNVPPAKDDVMKSSIVQENLPVKHSAVTVNITSSDQGLSIKNSSFQALAKPSSSNNSNVSPLAIPVTSPTAKPVRTSVGLQHLPEELNKRFEASKLWLATGAPETATLQIMTITNDEQLTDQWQLLAKQLDNNKLYMYRKNQGDKHYTVILYGDYQRRDAALADMETLPSSIQMNNPQIRTIAGIHRDIQQTQ